MSFNHPGWRFTGCPYLADVLSAEIDNYRRSIVIKKSSAVGWTEVACITAMRLAQSQDEKNVRMRVPFFKMTPLAWAVRTLATTDAVVFPRLGN